MNILRHIFFAQSALSAISNSAHLLVLSSMVDFISVRTVEIECYFELAFKPMWVFKKFSKIRFVFEPFRIFL